MLKKIIICLLFLVLAMPVMADNSSSTSTSASQDKKEGKDSKGGETTAKSDTGSKTEEKSGKDEKAAEEKKDPNVFECQYYTVTLSPGWTVVTPPTENQGTVTSVFKSNNGGVAVMLVLGKLGGAEAKTIAEMFAEQFKAEKPPVAKNGQYTFTFIRDGKPCEAFITSQDDIFMVTTISGNRKEATNFIKKQVKSEEYSKLLPQL